MVPATGAVRVANVSARCAGPSPTLSTMPPPSPSPSPSAPQVQVFGLENDRSTRAALRFFKDRRIAIHFVDLRRKPMAPGELRRFVERLGAPALVDRESRVYRDTGMGYLTMSDAELAERILADQRLLRLPLVRHGSHLSAGRSEPDWKAWFAATGP